MWSTQISHWRELSPVFQNYRRLDPCTLSVLPEPGLLGSTSPAVLPSLFLYFRHPDDNDVDEGESDHEMLQIVSKQAHLIDALMQTCVQLNQCGRWSDASRRTEQELVWCILNGTSWHVIDHSYNDVYRILCWVFPITIYRGCFAAASIWLWGEWLILVCFACLFKWLLV